MAYSPQQIGYSTEAKLLQQICKEFDKLIKIVAKSTTTTTTTTP